MLQAFVDDSGTGGNEDEPFFVLAGYIATAEAWAAFSDEWQAMLDYYRIPLFKMNEAASRWLSRGEIEPLMFFYRIIERHVLAEVRCIIPYSEWRAGIEDFPDGYNDSDVYYFMALQLVQALVYQRVNIGLFEEKIEIIFDEQRYYQEYIRSFWPNILRTSPPGVRESISGQPRFLKDSEFLPLQAADLNAWWTRKRWIGNQGKPGDFNWQYPWARQRTILGTENYYDRENVAEALWTGRWGEWFPFFDYGGPAIYLTDMNKLSVFGYSRI